MLGIHKAVSISYHPGGWVIEEHVGRVQPWSCWHGDNVYYFTDSLYEARRFCESQARRVKT